MLIVRTIGISEIVLRDRALGPECTASFSLLLLAALRAPRPLARAELGALLWPDVASVARNHRMRSLLHRCRQAGAPLACTETTVRLAEAPRVDFRELSTLPRGLEDVRRRAVEIGPILPGLEVVAGTALETRFDDERDAITATVVRWVSAALELAKAAGDWALVDSLARAGRAVDPYNEEAWASLAEARCLTARRVGELRAPASYTPPDVASSARTIHFSVRAERAGDGVGILTDLAARLLEEPGAAGCDPASYGLLRGAVATGARSDAGRTRPTFEQLGGALLELLAALTDEAMYVIVVDAPNGDAASDFWRAAEEWSSDRPLAWKFVSRPTRRPSAPP